jgi:hypothetical protein
MGPGQPMVLALLASGACPSSLPANLSVPGHHFQLRELQRVPGINGGPSVAIDG